MLHGAAVAAESESHSILVPEPADLIWGSIAFVIVLLVIWRLVIPNVTRAIDARRDAIEGGLKRAEEAQAEAANARDEYAAQLAEARAEAARIREQARQDGDKIIAEKKAAAQVEAARVAEQAQAMLEVERSAARSALRSEVGGIAVDLASRVVGESLSDDKKAAALVDRFLADLEASEVSAKAGK